MEKKTQEQVVVIRPRVGLQSLRLGEVWDHRDLLFLLARRDISSRYKQTLLGVAWAVFQPVMTVVIFSIVFGTLGKLPSEGKPYSVFVFTAIVVWQYFANATSNCANSLWGANAPLLTKIYFPRLILPLYSVLPPLLDFAIALCVLLAFMSFHQIYVSWTIILVPFLIGLSLMFALGIGLWWSALGAEYRDVRHALPVFIQVMLYASPVAYSTTLIPEEWRTFYALNPIVTVIEGVRQCMLGTRILTTEMIMASCIVAFITLLSGSFIFRQLERKLADVV